MEGYNFSRNIGIKTLFFAIAGVIFMMVPAHSQTMVVTQKDFDKHAGEIQITLNKSQVLNLDTPYKDALIGNPDIADIMPLTNKTIYILGKKTGSTSLTIYGANKSLIAVMDLVVTLDIDGLKGRLYELMPRERIEIRPANGSIIMSGSVRSAGILSKALAVGENFAPGKVTNLMAVNGSQQVLLEVKFAEMQRSAIKQLGMNLTAIGNDFFFSSGLGIRADAFSSGDVSFGIGSTDFNILFDTLEQNGLVKTLAEPNLVAMSGDTASFLVGGEFPVPVANQGGGGSTDQGRVGSAITIEFKEFGIALSFTPTVLDDGMINLVVAPEVSRIDRTTSVEIEGFLIPGLSTRRAKTTIELRDGYSFAIAGLIQSDFQDTVRQFPVLGNIPILGALFSNKRYETLDTELVIIVTPHLVTSGSPDQMILPTDGFILPNDFEFFMLGRMENKDSRKHLLAGNSPGLIQAKKSGGIDGQFGHIIE